MSTDSRSKTVKRNKDYEQGKDFLAVFTQKKFIFHKYFKKPKYEVKINLNKVVD